MRLTLDKHVEFATELIQVFNPQIGDELVNQC